MIRLLDLFCGAGGAAMGYHRAGFYVTGIDINPQPHYPFKFIQADALEYLAEHGREYDVIHASPPCQGYSRMRHLPWLKDKKYPLLIDPVRDLLKETGKIWIIENVSDSPLNGAELCGKAIGLDLRRHRRFESCVLLLFPPCPGHEPLISGPATMAVKYGRHGIVGYKSRHSYQITPGIGHNPGWRKAAEAMGIDWMNQNELTQAIPPAYTEFIGKQIIGSYVRN